MFVSTSTPCRVTMPVIAPVRIQTVAKWKVVKRCGSSNAFNKKFDQDVIKSASLHLDQSFLSRVCCQRYLWKKPLGSITSASSPLTLSLHHCRKTKLRPRKSNLSDKRHVGATYPELPPPPPQFTIIKVLLAGIMRSTLFGESMMDEISCKFHGISCLGKPDSSNFIFPCSCH